MDLQRHVQACQSTMKPLPLLATSITSVHIGLLWCLQLALPQCARMHPRLTQACPSTHPAASVKNHTVCALLRAATWAAASALGLGTRGCAVAQILLLAWQGTLAGVDADYTPCYTTTLTTCVSRSAAPESATWAMTCCLPCLCGLL
jgi:hypothetical protein